MTQTTTTTPQLPPPCPDITLAKQFAEKAANNIDQAMYKALEQNSPPRYIRVTEQTIQISWQQLEKDVVHSLKLLQAVHNAKQTPKAQQLFAQDCLIPIINQLTQGNQAAQNIVESF